MSRPISERLLAIALGGGLLSSISPLHGAPAGNQRAVENYYKLPLGFERTGERFAAHGQGYRIVVDHAKATVATTNGAAISIEMAGAHKVQAVPGPELAGKVNYIVGKDPARWRLGLAAYEIVSYREV